MMARQSLAGAEAAVIVDDAIEPAVSEAFGDQVELHLLDRAKPVAHHDHGRIGGVDPVMPTAQADAVRHLDVDIPPFERHFAPVLLFLRREGPHAIRPCGAGVAQW
jgi:hypothetical protein